MIDISLLNTIDVETAKENLIKLVKEANNQIESLHITIDDKPQAVLIGYEIFSCLMMRLDELEDQYDTSDVAEAIDRYQKDKNTTRSWDIVKTELYT